MSNILVDFQIERAFDSEETINIVFCPDNNYAKYFAVLLQSIIDNSDSNRFYDLLIFETDFTNKNKKLLLGMIPRNFSLRFFNISTYIKEQFSNIKLISKNYWSISTYYRLFIPLIMRKYKKVLYLDSDMCTNANIDELFSMDFENNELIAITDSISPILNSDINRFNYMEKVLNLKNPKTYFNAGFSLFNISVIDIIEYKERLLKAFSTDDLWFLDQDIMNIIFENRVKLIHNKWNFMWDGPFYFDGYIELLSGRFEQEYLEAKENPYIVHYSGGIKPWKMPEEQHSDIFWKYARKSPFYEEILYANLKTSSVDRAVIKNVILRKSIYLKYLKCKVLKLFTFGKRREHYVQKLAILKNQINDYRETLRK